MTSTLTLDWRRRPMQILAGVMLAALFILPCIAGMLSPYLAMIAALLAVTLVFRRDDLTAAFHDPAIIGFLVAFLLLALAFGLSARSPGDLLALGDFAVLAIAIPTFMLLRRTARVDGAFLLSLAALSGAILACLFGYYEVGVLGLERATGGFTPIYYSDLGVMLGFISLCGLFVPGPKWRWVLALGPLFGMQAIMLGGTRGALVGAVVLALAMLIFAPIKWSEQWKSVLTIAMLTVLGLALPAIVLDSARMLGTFGLLADALSDGRTADASANFRLEFYQGGLRAFLDSPIFGHGWWRRFTAAAPYMSPDAAALANTPGVGHLHNDTVNFLSAAGGLGLGAYVVMLMAPTLSAFRSPPDNQRSFRRLATVLLSVGILAFGLTDSVFVFELVKTYFCLGSVAIVAFCRDPIVAASKALEQR